MRVEMYDCDRMAICFVQSPERRQRNTVVTSQCNNLRLAEVLDPAFGTLISGFSAGKLKIGFAHLPQSKSIIEGCYGNVTTINDTRPGRVRV